ncbi:MAG TPA: GNAT family N-acetyltransferase [Solirubrobacterales bacterium]|jgi:GNAT superfamily N-acetyltransferase|nr:GNAT family N-acetyltransferase [Solirubrobacterales bacterium]
MSEPSPTVPQFSGSGATPRSGVRRAAAGDAPAVAGAIDQLLLELGGPRPAGEELEAATRALVEDPALGVVLIAETGSELVGLLAASWQHAIHVPGRYATIQDLWVLPAWRSKAIGHDLIEALCALAREQGVARLEVGLPKESFERIGSTESFYRANGFSHLGPRMRRLLGDE